MGTDPHVKAVPYEDEEDGLGRNPFARNWSVWRWDSSRLPAYRKMRRGDPETIGTKTESYRKAVAVARESLRAIDEAAPDLPENACSFFRFKLEENEFHLRSMCEIELAWLKAERRLYTSSGEERGRLRLEVERHLHTLEDLEKRTGESLTVQWLGRYRHLKRGAYLDLPVFTKNFRRYFAFD